MEAPEEQIAIRSSYNLGGISFTPREIAAEIKQHIPDFSISYAPDFRQKIADSWPGSIDDADARKDWGWKEKYDMKELVSVMLKNVDVNLLN
jgi:nucleoside-diphosphate-sugar epimerase